MLEYLHEAAGLVPWLGSEKDGVPTRPLGDHYFQLTAKGLTKELGFVGYYGEVLDWMTAMYDATPPGDGSARRPGANPGATRQGRQGARRVPPSGARRRRQPRHARGNRSSAGATRVTIRATSPTRNARRGTPPPSLPPPPRWTRRWSSYAQQMFADNQFFATVADQLKTRPPGCAQTAGIRADRWRLRTPAQAAAVRQRPPADDARPAGFRLGGRGGRRAGRQARRRKSVRLAVLAGALRGQFPGARALHHSARGPHCRRARRRTIRAERPVLVPAGLGRTWASAAAACRYPGDLHSAVRGRASCPSPKFPTG